MNAALARKRSFVVTLGSLMAMAALTIDISLPAIPEMVRALHTDLPRGQLIVGVFIAGMAFGQIPAGLFSDRLGRLPVLYVGVVIYSLSASVAAVSNDIGLLLATRFLQGFGAAAALVLARAIVRDIASGREAARLMSLMTMIFTAAPVIAPSIGALLVSAWGWRAPMIFVAVFGFLMIGVMRHTLVETHRPDINERPLRQLQSSVVEFFSHRQSIFGLLLIVVPPIGFMSMIATSAALTVDMYGYSVQSFGLIFAGAGLSVLSGAAVNRFLVSHLELMKVIAIGITLIGVASVQLAVIAWCGEAPFAWLWGCLCLYMFTLAMVMSNALVIALDPLPKIAGVASSIIGTINNLLGAAGAVGGAMLYDGSLRNAVLIIAGAGSAAVIVFLLRPIICSAPIVHDPQELARE